MDAAADAQGMNVLGTQRVGFACFFTSKASNSQHAAADAEGMNVFGTQFTCFTRVKKNSNTDVLHLRHRRRLRGRARRRGDRGTSFTCFTSTKVQILTPAERGSRGSDLQWWGRR